MNETTAFSFIAFFAALVFVSGIGGCTYNAKLNTENDTLRMTKCIEKGKDWLYVDDAQTFQCVGGR